MGSKTQEIMNELVDVVGPEQISCAPEDLIAYSRDMTSNLRKASTLPDFVIIPENVLQLQEVVRLANRYKVPVLPKASGTNAAGMTLTRNGGIVLDLKLLDKVEIIPETMTAIIEAGATWGKAVKEAKKYGLKVPVLAGPYSGTPVGNFVCYNISFYNSRYSFSDRVLSLEAVLPNGELLRTGSGAYLGHEKTYPSFRYAYGPDITGLFRGSTGAFGIVTKVAYRLLPIREREEHIDIAFDDIESLCSGIKEIESYDVTSYLGSVCKKNLANIVAPGIKVLEDPVQVEELENSLPEYTLFTGIEGTTKQVDLYREMIGDAVNRSGGKYASFTGKIKENLEDLLPGGGIRINRMFRHQSIAMLSILLLSKVPAVRRKCIEIARRHDMYDPNTKKPLIPLLFIVPYNRASDVYLEQDIPISLENPQKTTQFYMELRSTIDNEYEGSSLNLSPALQSNLIPSYVDFIAGIKRLLDPNLILAPGKLIRI